MLCYTTQEYDRARAAVEGGNASSTQVDMVRDEAKHAGNRAREALRSAGLA